MAIFDVLTFPITTELKNYFTGDYDSGHAFRKYSLAGLSRINIFIGANNSGKSRYLREIAGRQDVAFRKYPTDYPDVARRKYVFEGTNDEIINATNDYMNHKYIPIDDEVEAILGYSVIPQKIYIPLLRTTQIFTDGKRFNVKVTQMYPMLGIAGNGPKKNIKTGQDMYNILVRMMTGNLRERKLVSEYEKFLSEYIFNYEPIALIPKYHGNDGNNILNYVEIKIGDYKERKLHELGDGVQAMILLTFPIFMLKDKTAIICIEEPEINMHPGMQRIFFNLLLLDIFKNLQFFFTTHSNHFIDLSLDHKNCSIYKFKEYKLPVEHVLSAEIEQSLKEAVSTEGELYRNFIVTSTIPKDIEILDELGIKNSSIFLANCTIWVEGITDRLYLRMYLKKYLEDEVNKDKFPNYFEDLHYAFVEYSGSNIEHWTFDDTSISSKINAKAINQRILVIADEDGNTKINRDNRLQDELGDKYYKLDVREIENTLCDVVLRKTVLVYEDNANKVKGNQKTCGFEFEDFKASDYEKEKIGEYINLKLGTNLIKNTYASESGSLLNSLKSKFAKSACDIMENMTYDEIKTDPIENIICKIIKLIEDSNADKVISN